MNKAIENAIQALKGEVREVRVSTSRDSVVGRASTGERMCSTCGEVFKPPVAWPVETRISEYFARSCFCSEGCERDYARGVRPQNTTVN